MKDLTQQIIKFDHEINYKDEDFFISKSNQHILKFLNEWPKWEKNFLNIIGEKFSGKSHIIDIFLKKFNGVKYEAKSLNNDILKEIKLYQNIVIENLNEKINEKLVYTLFNIVDQDNKKILNFEKKLNETNLIYDYFISRLDKDFVYYRIIYNGTPNNFLKSMGDMGYNFNTQNRFWILK